jgi:hypothetical protein
MTITVNVLGFYYRWDFRFEIGHIGVLKRNYLQLDFMDLHFSSLQHVLVLL